MSVEGINSDQLRSEGVYFESNKPPPLKGNAWTYRVIKSKDNPKLLSIHKVFYKTGKILTMSCYPVTCLANPTKEEPEFSLLLHMRRVNRAMDAPALNESEVVKHKEPPYRCRSCGHEIPFMDLPEF